MTVGAHDSPTQRVFTRLYGRFGPRVLFVAAFGTAAIGFVLIWLAAAWGVPFIDPTLEEMLVGTALLTLVALPVVGAILYFERDQATISRTIRRGPPSADPPTGPAWRRNRGPARW